MADTISHMNAFNALGFLAVGSLMNALPAVAPSLVARGAMADQLSASAIWLHFMGLVIGLIGVISLMREGIAFYAATSSAPLPARRPVTVPRRVAAPAPAVPSAQPAPVAAAA